MTPHEGAADSNASEEGVIQRLLGIWVVDFPVASLDVHLLAFDEPKVAPSIHVCVCGMTWSTQLLPTGCAWFAIVNTSYSKERHLGLVEACNVGVSMNHARFAFLTIAIWARGSIDPPVAWQNEACVIEWAIAIAGRHAQFVHARRVVAGREVTGCPNDLAAIVARTREVPSKLAVVVIHRQRHMRAIEWVLAVLVSIHVECRRPTARFGWRRIKT
mmetsp:Transcript_27354/g.63806  ORF Transcript_27354/g.63806 Transcript_27354/m.63806 type:complete len:216 (-) Transcript_27354:1470-2117(-)